MSGCSDKLRPAASRAEQGWKRKILAAAVLGALPLVVGCASSVKQSHEITNASPALDRPMVLSGRPDHDSLVNAAVDEQLSEADWKVLESLGPKAIWDRIADMSRSAKETRSRVAAGATTHPGGSLARTSSTRPALTLEEVAASTPAITLPDGKIRLIYSLRNYGGTNVTAATDSGTSSSPPKRRTSRRWSARWPRSSATAAPSRRCPTRTR